VVDLVGGAEGKLVVHCGEEVLLSRILALHLIIIALHAISF
jgi:hypothetical protein